MEISLVRKRLTDTIEHARRAAAARRTAIEDASRQYSTFLDQRAVPLVRQLANALKAAGYPFVVSTPSGIVRLSSEKAADDFLELWLETSGEEPQILLRTSRVRGRRHIEAERPVGKGPIEGITEDLLLDVLLQELEPYVER